MINNKIVDLAFADGILDLLDKLREEAVVDGINQRHLVSSYDVRIVRYTIGQWPKAFKSLFVAVVDADIPYMVC